MIIKQLRDKYMEKGTMVWVLWRKFPSPSHSWAWTRRTRSVKIWRVWRIALPSVTCNPSGQIKHQSKNIHWVSPGEPDVDHSVLAMMKISRSVLLPSYPASENWREQARTAGFPVREYLLMWRNFPSSNTLVRATGLSWRSTRDTGTLIRLASSSSIILAVSRPVGLQTRLNCFYSDDYKAFNTKLQFVRIFFDTPTFDRIRKDSRIKFADCISAVGGTMGLFTGFSGISAIEILYFIFKSIGYICKSRKSMKKWILYVKWLNKLFKKNN